MFSFYCMYGHGKLDLLVFIYMQCQKRVAIFLSVEMDSTKINQNVYTSKAQNAEENSLPRVL